MNIKTLYYLGAGITVLIMLAIGVMSSVAAARMNHALERGKLASEILVGIGELRYLRSEYTLYRHARPREQWLQRHASIAALLARDTFEGAGQQRIVSVSRQRHQEMKEAFSRLAWRYAAAENGTAEAGTARELETRLIGQLDTISQELLSGALRVWHASEAELANTGRWSNVANALAIGLMGLIFAANTVLGIRYVLDPLGRLQRGTRVIGDGDLSYRTGITRNDEIGALSRSFDRMTEHLQQSRAALEEKTARLVEANQELESFSYSVSHDLRAPLRAIDGFSQRLLAGNQDTLDESGRHCLDRIRAGAQTMAMLIDDLLNLSRVSRTQLKVQPVDLGALARRIVNELQQSEPQRGVEFAITADARAQGDERLLEIALRNLLGNAWKFTSKCDHARIEFGVTRRNDAAVYFVRDNGAGFDMAYAEKLFAPFQRLHRAAEFPGTGIGLAIVRRILQRHGGSVWAEAAMNEGAAFYFTFGAAGEKT